MLRVLHISSGNLFGGVETFLLTLGRCRRFAPSMETAVALCFDEEVAERLRADAVPVAMLGAVRLRRPDTVWRARQALRALLTRGRFDVVVCHQAWPLAIFGPVVKSAGLPLVSWVHMAGGDGHWLNRAARRVQPDCYVYNSRFSASAMTSPRARVEVIYVPVVPADPSPVRARPAGERAEVVVVQVSRMEAGKGQRVLLEALGRLAGERGWTCWQVGGAQNAAETAYQAELRELAARVGIGDRVAFLGHRHDVPALLASADVFCQPNVGPEGFGISFVEAMLAGLPVVGSAAGGALEIIDETCGVLTPPGDATALAAVLSRLIRDRAERERLGRAGPDRAKRLCDPESQMKKIAALLEDVAGVRA